MKKRVYQLGITTGVCNKDLNALLRAKDGLILLHGEMFWKKLYKDMCNKVRKHFNIPYFLGLARSTDDNDKETIGITVFEHIADDSFYDVHMDEEKQMHYIEVDDEEKNPQDDSPQIETFDINCCMGTSDDWLKLGLTNEQHEFINNIGYCGAEKMGCTYEEYLNSIHKDTYSYKVEKKHGNNSMLTDGYLVVRVKKV